MGLKGGEQTKKRKVSFMLVLPQQRNEMTNKLHLIVFYEVLNSLQIANILYIFDRGTDI